MQPQPPPPYRHAATKLLKNAVGPRTEARGPTKCVTNQGLAPQIKHQSLTSSQQLTGGGDDGFAVGN